MNLYAIIPAYGPPVSRDSLNFVLAKDDAEALDDAIYVAANDAVNAYGSPSADVYLIAENVKHIGEAHATDAPRDWEWAHPGVAENAAQNACWEAEHEAGWPAG